MVGSRPSPPDDACVLCGGAQRARYDLGSHRLLYCSRCQLGQLSPLPTDAELAALYASPAYFSGGDAVGYADYVADAPQHARSFRARLERLLRHGPIGDLLEIGCGPGLFLAEARRLGVTRVVGVDPNPWAVEQACARGVEAHVGSVETLDPSRRFDAVVMLDVLEHVVAPLPFFAAVRARLQPDGRLLVMTPNIRSLLARLSGRRWVSLKTPEHVRYYSPRSIRALLDVTGFDVLAIHAAGQYVTVAFFLARLERLVPRSARVLRRIVDALALGGRVVFLTNGSIDVVARPVTSAVDSARTRR
ncbi:MAG: class I SAM-dependent methyltransferase [Deltaproteobacteria bacterium]|nr:class I SAM-dependent methyltransferase [Deltaproteobacteria bacterium]